MGITVDEPAFVYGDNQSVLANTTNPSSTLNKKLNAIAYHFVWEGCARDEWRMAYVNTHDNVADLLTKPLAGLGSMYINQYTRYHFTTVSSGISIFFNIHSTISEKMTSQNKSG